MNFFQNIRLFAALLATCFCPNVWAQIHCDIQEIREWRSGFVLNNILVTNTGSTDVDWKVTLDFARSVDIVDAWSAQQNKLSNDRFSFEGVSYNRSLAPGASAEFGFKGAKSGGSLGNVVCTTNSGNNPQPTREPIPTSTPTPSPSPSPSPTIEPTPAPNAIMLPGRIETEDYISFSDSTPENLGNAYRNDAVDIQVTSDSGGGYNVGWIAAGESLTYGVNVDQNGQYRFAFRVASLKAGGRMRLWVDGNLLLDDVSFNATGGWQTWTTIYRQANLNAGEHTMVLEFLSSSFNINYINVQWLGDSTPTPEPTPTLTPTPTSTPFPDNGPITENNDDWLSADGNIIVNRQGQPVWLTGTNWFGFNTGTNAFDGLWSANLEDAMQAMADRGINFLRVPISVELVRNWSRGNAPMPRSLNTSANPNLAGLDSLQVFDYFLEVAKDVGIKVMVDFHSARTDPLGHLKPLWYDDVISVDDLYSGWEWMAQRYKNEDTILAFDLKNEPHGKPWQGPAAVWDNSNSPNNWKRVAEEAALRILAIHPNILIMVEGNESTLNPGANPNSNNPSDWYSTWWGGNLRGVRDYPIDLGVHQNKLVYSPHDYGPLVFRQPWFNKPFDKNSLYQDVWQPNWAFIMEENIAPLLIGEWGGFMDGGDNQKWMEAIRDYIVEERIHHTFWCFNANSGDTGGLVENDFTTWDEEKYALLRPSLWQTPSGKFVGLDHRIPLGRNGITVKQYYDQNHQPPVR